MITSYVLLLIQLLPDQARNIPRVDPAGGLYKSSIFFHSGTRLARPHKHLRMMNNGLRDKENYNSLQIVAVSFLTQSHGPITDT